MTDVELITDDIVKKAFDAAKDMYCGDEESAKKVIRAILVETQDDIVRPYRNLFMGYKRDAIAYEKALKEIRDTIIADSHMIADRALKGKYHETDFTEFCKGNEKKMITTIIEYECDICKKKYKTQEEATGCENQGVTKQQFNIGDVVYIKTYGAQHYDENNKAFKIDYTKDEITAIHQEGHHNVYITKASYGWDERNEYGNSSGKLSDDYLCDYALSMELYDEPEMKIMTTVKPNEKYIIADAIPNYNYDCWT